MAANIPFRDISTRCVVPSLSTEKWPLSSFNSKLWASLRGTHSPSSVQWLNGKGTGRETGTNSSRRPGGMQDQMSSNFLRVSHCGTLLRSPSTGLQCCLRGLHASCVDPSLPTDLCTSWGSASLVRTKASSMVAPLLSSWDLATPLFSFLFFQP